MCENMFVFKVIDPKMRLSVVFLFLSMQVHWEKKEILESGAFFNDYILIMADLSSNLFLVLLERRLPFLKWIFR